MNLLNIGLKFLLFVKSLLNTIISIFKILFFSIKPYTLPMAQKENVSILGNGPSLKESLIEDLNFIKNTEIFCVNAFASSKEYELLKPTNYVLLDPAHFKSETMESHIHSIQQMLKDIVSKTNWKLNLYVPKSAKKSTLLNEIIKNKNIQIHFYNYTIVNGFEFFLFWVFKSKLGFIQSQSVLVCAIFLAINAKFKNIYVFGADSSWHEAIKIDESNKFITISSLSHFYTETNKKDLIQKPLSISLSTQFTALGKIFFGFEVLQKYAKSMKINIFNASKKSYIDAFERVKV